MDDRWRMETKPLILEGGIHMPYSWTIGRVGSRFFCELRDHARILAYRCAKCERVWVPPRLRCPVCFKQMAEKDWMEVGPEGTLRHFTVVRYHYPGQPLKTPFAYGLIDLDGADVAIIHLLSDKAISKLKAGVRVRPVMAEPREGKILDIAFFTPIGD